LLRNVVNKSVSNIKDESAFRQLDRVTDARSNLARIHIRENRVHAPKTYSDVMLLDIGLEAYAVKLVDRVLAEELGEDGKVGKVFIGMLVKNLHYSYEWEELSELCEVWDEMMVGPKGPLDVAPTEAEVFERIRNMLVQSQEVMTSTLQEKAALIGGAMSAESETIENFSEDSYRGSLFYSLLKVMLKREEAKNVELMAKLAKSGK
jgi:hypothetical protein